MCSCHNQERWILNKKGECNETIKKRREQEAIEKRRRKEIAEIYPPPDRSLKKYVELTSNIPWKKNKTSPPRRKPIQRNKKSTGEGEVFKEIWENALQKSCPQYPRCCVCSTSLGFEARAHYFSHVLAKSVYNLFRKWKVNIWLECFTCHDEWGNGQSDHPKFAAKRIFAEKLKQFYYEIKDLPEEDQKQEMINFEYENL